MIRLIPRTLFQIRIRSTTLTSNWLDRSSWFSAGPFTSPRTESQLASERAELAPDKPNDAVMREPPGDPSRVAVRSPAEHFLTTRWTQVLAAQGASTKAGKALADLCACYYSPVHAYITRTARDLGDARDLTQEFFSRLLTGGSLAGVEREKGRFRAYLLGAVKHFLADTRDRLGAAKRGRSTLMCRWRQAPIHRPGWNARRLKSRPPDACFDRQWGLAVLDLALASLAAEHREKGKPEHFQILKPWLTGDAMEMSQTEAAARLGISEGAVKVAIHRLRKRFRELVKAEIAADGFHRGGGSRGIAILDRGGELTARLAAMQFTPEAPPASYPCKALPSSPRETGSI